MDLSGSSGTGADDVATTVIESPGTSADKAAKPAIYPVEVDHSRDSLLTDFGKETLNDRYLLPGETYQDLFVRVASAYADDAEHAQRVYDYISKLWFMPATPGPLERRHRARPPDQLLSELRPRQP